MAIPLLICPEIGSNTIAMIVLLLGKEGFFLTYLGDIMALWMVWGAWNLPAIVYRQTTGKRGKFIVIFIPKQEVEFFLFFPYSFWRAAEGIAGSPVPSKNHDVSRPSGES